MGAIKASGWVGRAAVGCVAVSSAILLGGPAVASADVRYGVRPIFASPLTVGQTTVNESLSISNTSTGNEAVESAPGAPITLVPSCGAPVDANGNCPAGSRDPGVLVLSSKGKGRAGTQCAGLTFNMDIVDAAQGKYGFFFPAFVLDTTGGANDTCVIDFTFDVVKAPTIDAAPGVAGLQTDQGAFVSGSAPDDATGSSTGDAQMTITKADVALSTAVSLPRIALGGSFVDDASVDSTPSQIVPGGHVTFNVYGPADPTCAGPIRFSSANPVLKASAAHGGATSDNFTLTSPGTYRVIASYSGDASYNPLVAGCNAPNETVVVPAPKADVAISTGVSPATLRLGGSFDDGATVRPTSGQATPTGTVTFSVFGPGDTTCSGPVKFTSPNSLTATLGAAAQTSSDRFTPASAGIYRVVASYAGDANTNPGSTKCNDAGESVTVLDNVTLTTQATPASASLGDTITDSASVTSVPGQPTPTGSVTFKTYGPGDAGCAGPVRFSSTNDLSTDAANATEARSDEFTPTLGGIYRFVATYNGDGNFNPVTTACADAGEAVTLTTSPAISVTKAASPLTLPAPGGAITFTVTASNPSVVDPITITSLLDDVYGDLSTRGDSTCGTLVGTTLAPGATSSPCSFTGELSGGAGKTETDTVTISGADSIGNAATDTARATVTLTKAAPTIATQASAGIALGGGTLTDKVTLSGGDDPGGSVWFTAFGPDDATCSGPVAFTSTKSLGGTDTSDPFTPKQAGVYRWTASYSGDANNKAATTACADPAETVSVSKAQPTIATTTSPTGALGGSTSDTATLAGGVAPTGTLTFKLYGPNDLQCSSPGFTSTKAVGANGDYASAPATLPAPGAYYWVAAYSGDANNLPAASACGPELVGVPYPAPAPPSGKPAPSPGPGSTPGSPASTTPAQTTPPLTPSSPNGLVLAGDCGSLGAQVDALLSTQSVASDLTGGLVFELHAPTSIGLRVVLRAKDQSTGGYLTLANLLTHAAGQVTVRAPDNGLGTSYAARATKFLKTRERGGRSLVIFRIVHCRADKQPVSAESVAIGTLRP